MIYSRCTAGVLLGGLAFLCFAQAPPKKGKSDVKKQAFGKMPDGTAVDLYTLTNARGMQAEIATYGGAVVSLTAPDRAGKFADVVMGMDNLEGYRDADVLSSARSIGRYGNRIAHGKFTLEGKSTRCPE